MVQSLSNFTRNALEMPKTPIANAIVELNHKKKSFPLDMIGAMLKMGECFHSLHNGKKDPLVFWLIYIAVFVCLPAFKTNSVAPQLYLDVCHLYGKNTQ